MEYTTAQIMERTVDLYEVFKLIVSLNPRRYENQTPTTVADGLVLLLGDGSYYDSISRSYLVERITFYATAHPEIGLLR